MPVNSSRRRISSKPLVIHRRSNEMADNEDTRARQRHTAYSNCVDKLKTSEFDEDLLDNDDHFAFEK